MVCGEFWPSWYANGLGTARRSDVLNTVARTDPRIQEARVTDDEIVAYLVDGRVVSVPLAWSWRLSDATPAQRANFRLIGIGQGIHWPEIDEDISIEGMLHGMPARRLRSSGAASKARSAGSQASPRKRTQPAFKRAARG